MITARHTTAAEAIAAGIAEHTEAERISTMTPTDVNTVHSIEQALGKAHRDIQDAMFMARTCSETGRDYSHWIAKARSLNRERVHMLRDLSDYGSYVDWTAYRYGDWIDRYGFTFDQ